MTRVFVVVLISLRGACLAHADIIKPDPLETTAKLGIGGLTYPAPAILDSGATAEGDVAGTSIPVPATQISRIAAFELGMINADGTLNSTFFETDAGGKIRTVEQEQGDGTKVTGAVSKPVSIAIADSNGDIKSVSIRVTVPTDPAKSGNTLIGEDFLEEADATITYNHTSKKKVFTWDNPPAEKFPGAKKKSEIKLPTTPGWAREAWDGITYASATADVTGSIFLMFESPYTILSHDLVTALGLTTIGTIDLTSDSGLLDDLEKAGFYADSAPNFGRFDEALLPLLEVSTDGLPVKWFNVPVLVNPIGNQNLLGFELIANADGFLGDLPLDETVFLAATGDTWFIPTPEPSTILLFATVLAAGAAVEFRRRHRRSVQH